MRSARCPLGHESITRDRCDTCGASIHAVPEPSSAPAVSGGSAPAPAPDVGDDPPRCPVCTEPAGGRFCERCGFDFVTGAPLSALVALDLSADRGHWDRMVGAGEPAFPAVPPTLCFELTGDRMRLGRGRAGSAAGVDLRLMGAAADPGVSHHQCVFERTGAIWAVRDAGSANGTWMNDEPAPLDPGTRRPLAAGDRIFMGAWTCLTVRIVARTP